MQIARFPEEGPPELLSPKKAEQHIPDINRRWFSWDNPPWSYLNTLGLYQYTAPVAGEDYDPATQALDSVILTDNQATRGIQPLPLAKVQGLKQDEIRDAFEQEMRTGTATTAGGWQIDARRSDIHNDLENMQALHDELTAAGAPGADIMGADNQLHACTVAEVADLVSLLRQTGLARYQKRHALKAQIDAVTVEGSASAEEMAAAVAEVVAIQW